MHGGWEWTGLGGGSKVLHDLPLLPDPCPPGGIFMYPADTKSTNGKLRVLYEAPRSPPPHPLQHPPAGLPAEAPQRQWPILWCAN